MAARFRDVIDISVRSFTDLLISGSLSQVIDNFFDNAVVDIKDNEQFFKELIKLVIQVILTVVAGIEMKGFFYDPDFSDPTQGIAFPFLLMLQNNILIRYKAVFKYISNKFLTFLSTVDTPETPGTEPPK